MNQGASLWLVRQLFWSSRHGQMEKEGSAGTGGAGRRNESRYLSEGDSFGDGDPCRGLTLEMPLQWNRRVSWEEGDQPQF
jgi:hypothetical protein